MRQALTSKAKWQQDGEGTWICFCVPADVAAKMVQDLQSGKEHQITLKQYRKKRSKDANAYFWTLVSQLSEQVCISPKDIYRHYVEDVGGNYYIVPVRSDLVNQISDMWCEGHDGRLTVDMGPCKNTTGYNNVRLYIGSSDYDTRQMSRLIDLVVQDCKACGIETLTPREKEAMLMEWANG